MAKEYILTLPKKTDNAIASMAYRLNVEKDEVIRRALALLEAAIDADKVLLIRNNEEIVVRIKD